MKSKYIYILFALFMIAGHLAKAQINPLGATFYQNQYLGNPAMAGLSDGLHLNAGFNKQWSSIPSSPTNQFVTLDNRAKRVGVGLNMYTDKAGLLKRTRIVGSYAYHLPLNSHRDELHFGLSIGALSERLSTEDVVGNISDPSSMRFNERDAVLDGDFGIAYTTAKFTIQAAIPNIKNFLKKERYNTANWNSYLAAISYKIMTDSTRAAFMIEPKLSFRGVRGYDDVIDAGINFATASNKLYASLIYHSTESISFGMGLNYKEFTLSGMFTSGTSALRGYNTGNFEIGFGYHFKKKK